LIQRKKTTRFARGVGNRLLAEHRFQFITRTQSRLAVSAANQDSSHEHRRKSRPTCLQLECIALPLGIEVTAVFQIAASDANVIELVARFLGAEM